MGYDPTGNNKDKGQGGQRQDNKSSYTKNSGSYNNSNNNRSAPARNSNNNSGDKKSTTVAAAWKRDDGSILVKFNGDEERNIPAFDMFLNESKFADGKKPDYVAFKTAEPFDSRKSNG